MKINWFAPLPPAKTGVADYLMAILPELAARADVTLWTDQKKWDPALAREVHVRTYHTKQMPWEELNRADLNVYNLGNNHLFHGSIWQVARRQPGAVVLHDLRLNDFFYNLYLDHFDDAPGFVAHMEKYYGQEGRRAAEMCLINGPVVDLAQSYPLTALALENSLGVVVHTREAQQELTPANRWLVAYAPLPFSPLPPSPVTVKKPARDDQPYRLIIFGFISRNRQVKELLEALAAFSQKKRFVLDIYGDVWDAGEVHQQIRSLGLTENVRLRGFTSQASLDSALASADLAINLRFPTMGEASISQLRIWAHSLPSIVTSVGWYGELPETAVAHVRPGHEVADIQAHLNAFLSDPARFQSMGQEGHRMLEAHKPDDYVETVLNLANQALLFRPRAAAYGLADRVGMLMSAWADVLSSDQALRKAAEEILTLTNGPTASS